MSEKVDIVEGPIGEKGKYDLEFREGALAVAIGYDAGFAKGSVTVEIPVDILLAKLKEAIPGQIDDVIIDGIRSALLKK